VAAVAGLWRVEFPRWRFQPQRDHPRRRLAAGCPVVVKATPAHARHGWKLGSPKRSMRGSRKMWHSPGGLFPIHLQQPHGGLRRLVQQSADQGRGIYRVPRWGPRASSTSAAQRPEPIRFSVKLGSSPIRCSFWPRPPKRGTEIRRGTGRVADQWAAGQSAPNPGNPRSWPGGRGRRLCRRPRKMQLEQVGHKLKLTRWHRQSLPRRQRAFHRVATRCARW